MNHVRKLRLVPFECSSEKIEHFEDNEKINQDGAGIKIIPKDKTKPKVLNAINLIMRLAEIRGYNSDGKIRDKDGSFFRKFRLGITCFECFEPPKISVW